MNARFLLLILLTFAGLQSRAQIPDNLTCDELQARMASGSLSSHALTQFYLDRIAVIDKHGPQLNAVIELNPQALAIADQLDAERRDGKVRGPLHGIPVLIKDNIATADEMETTAGSLAMLGSKPKRDAFLVERLRQAGAVILGKTNLSEWANLRGERAPGGWSARGGQTHNPHALDRSPNGSSSGSAVAVAANLCVVTVGTETSGSVSSPASANGIVGLKPTVGAVSRRGVIPISAAYDTPGTFGRTVRDAALLLSTIAATDPADEATQHIPATYAQDLIKPFARHALRGARIGYIRATEMRPDLSGQLTAAIQTLRTAGAEVIELGEFPRLAEVQKASFQVMLYGLKAGVNGYLADLGPGAKMKSLEDVIRFNDEHWAREQPLFGQQTLHRAQAKGPLTEPAYLEALATSQSLTREQGIDRIMHEHRLDALISLANAPSRLSLPPESGDPLFGPKGPGGSGYAPAAIAGYPSVTVPMTKVYGLPVGLIFYGGAWTDAKLLAYAAEFDALTQARTTPTFQATASAQ